MPTTSSSMTSGAQPRKLARTLCVAAALAAAGLFSAAHATYPGQNGVIVFENSLTHMIGRADPGGGAVTYLTPGNSPAVSPNGKKIAYSLNGNIRVINIDGTNDVQLTTGPTDTYPAWTTGNDSIDLIAFIRNKTELWTTDLNGRDHLLRQLTANTSYTASNLDWAPARPDRSNLYAYALDPNTGSPSIYISTGVGNDTNLGKGSYPSYAPDGQSIIYSGPDWKAYEQNTNATDDHAVPAAGLTSRNAISPDGALVAAGVGDGITNLLQTRPHAGGPATVKWREPVQNLSWSRLPQNCYETTPQGGGGVLAGNTEFYAEQCAVVVMPDGGQMSGGVLMQAVAIGPDKRVYLSMLRKNSSGVPTWSPFALTIGAFGQSNGIVASNVAIAGSKDGSSQLVVTNWIDGTVYHTMRHANGAWQKEGFQPVMNGGTVFKARDVAITINASSASSPGNAQVIANGAVVGSVFHTVRGSNGSWSEWGEVPGATGLDTRQLAIAAGEDGNTYVLTMVVQPDSTAQLKRQVRYANSSWGPAFVNVPAPGGVLNALTSQIALTLTAGSPSKAQLIYTDSIGTAWFQERSDPLNQSSWTGSALTTQVGPSGGNRTVSISAQPSGTGTSEVMLVRASAQ